MLIAAPGALTCLLNSVCPPDRHMVLRHHPDKRRGAGEEVRDGDDYFTNITKAYETLGDPIKRRAFDSVDPEFDDKVPSDKPANKEKFYEVSTVLSVALCTVNSSNMVSSDAPRRYQVRRERTRYFKMLENVTLNFIQ